MAPTESIQAWWKDLPVKLNILLYPVGLHHVTRYDIVGIDNAGKRYFLGSYSPANQDFKPGISWPLLLRTESKRIKPMKGNKRPGKTTYKVL